MNAKTILRSMRIPFLILTPVCIFLGASTVAAKHGRLDLVLLLLTLLGALLAHISVNTLNEYFDFKSGLDFITEKTAFSGGSGSLPQNPEMAGRVFFVAATSIFAMFMIGLFFVWKHGAGIVPVGLLGLIIIISYTGWINRHPLLCLIAPGIGFGFLMVAGTGFVLQGEHTLLPWLVAVIPFFLVNNLLLLNQYPDINADASIGRNHFPIAYGVKSSNRVYGFFTSATAAIIIIYIVLGYLPTLSLIALLPMPLAVFSLTGAVKYGGEIGQHPQYLGANVAITIMVPLLLGISMVYS